MAKNEHIVWAYGDKDDGTGQVLILGLTDVGIDYLKGEQKTLVVNPPGKGFANVAQIVVFYEKDKASLKEKFRQAGVQVLEAN